LSSPHFPPPPQTLKKPGVAIAKNTVSAIISLKSAVSLPGKKDPPINGLCKGGPKIVPEFRQGAESSKPEFKGQFFPGKGEFPGLGGSVVGSFPFFQQSSDCTTVPYKKTMFPNPCFFSPGFAFSIDFFFARDQLQKPKPQGVDFFGGDPTVPRRFCGGGGSRSSFQVPK